MSKKEVSTLAITLSPLCGVQGSKCSQATDTTLSSCGMYSVHIPPCNTHRYQFNYTASYSLALSIIFKVSCVHQTFGERIEVNRRYTYTNYLHVSHIVYGYIRLKNVFTWLVIEI